MHTAYTCKERHALFAENHTGTLACWIQAVEADPVARAITASKPFRRLNGISFLGALDHIAPTAGLKKAPRTRGEHSLHVAALAAFVAHKRHYDEDLTRHLIVAGLLHDIGHPPLSHSVEPYLKKRFGYGHHEMGEMLISGQHSLGRKLSKVLRHSLDTAFVSELIAGNAHATAGGDLFSSPINIDTIEGIIRSYRYLRDTPTALDPLQVAEASFVDQCESRFDVLDRFWAQKDFIYNRLITQDMGLIADQYSQHYFIERGQRLDEGDLFQTERQWQNKHPRLFGNLLRINGIGDIPTALESATLKYNRRHYEVEAEMLNAQRYRCTREAAQKTLPRGKITSDRQVSQLKMRLH